jgi:ferredoxin
MAYVINEPCIGTKGISCVEVCPVDCIHPTPDEPGFDEADQLYIDPEECIDCDACVEACPVDAIASEDQVPPEAALHPAQRRLRACPPPSRARPSDPARRGCQHRALCR